MKQLFLENSMNFICKYQSISNYNKKRILYGLEGLYLTISKMILLTVLAIVLGIVQEFILVIVFFNVIRYTGFGFHAEKSFQCLLFSTFNFIAIPFFLLHIQLSTFLVYVICAICIFHYLLFAPADTKKRPLSNKKKRAIRKTLTVMIGLIYTAIIIFLQNDYWTSIFLSALIVQAIVINPVTYKLFGQSYNNYKAFDN